MLRSVEIVENQHTIFQKWLDGGGALKRQRQVDSISSKPAWSTSASSRTAWAVTQGNPVSNKRRTKQNKEQT